MQLSSRHLTLKKFLSVKIDLSFQKKIGPKGDKGDSGYNGLPVINFFILVLIMNLNITFSFL